MATEPRKLHGEAGWTRCAARRIGWNVRVILAVVWQRALTFVRYPANFISALVAPFVSLAVSVFMARAFSGVSSGMDGAVAAPGLGVTGTDYRSYLLASTVLWAYIESQLSLGFSIETDMRRGTLETVFLTPTSRWCYLTGQAVYQFLRSTVNAAVAGLLGILAFGAAGNPSWPRVAGVFALNLLVVYGYGLILAGTILVFRSGLFSYVWDSVLPLLVGYAFSVKVLPQFLQKLSKAIPLTYGMDLLRWVVAGSPTLAAPKTEVGILLASALLLPAAGFGAFALLEKVVKRRGTLGQF